LRHVRQSPANFFANVSWNDVTPKPNAGSTGNASHLGQLWICNTVARGDGSAAGSAYSEQDRSRNLHCRPFARSDYQTNSTNQSIKNNAQNPIKRFEQPYLP
jgi:hypothetical protein